MGNLQTLEPYDRTIKDFLWSGQESGKRPRVEYATITKPKSKGGLGLISMKYQMMAMPQTTMLGIVVEGEHDPKYSSNQNW